MHRFTKHPFGARAISLLLAASLALGVPMTALAQGIDPAPTTPTATEPQPAPAASPDPEESPSVAGDPAPAPTAAILQPAFSPQPDSQDEFEEQLAAGERVRLALASEPQANGLRTVSERDAQYEALAQACMNAFAEDKTQVPLADYDQITVDEFQTLRDTLRCLPGGEKAGEMELITREEGETKVPDYYEITFLTPQEQADIETAIEYFCSFADQGDTDFEKILLVHDALLLNVEYAVVALVLQENNLNPAPNVVYDPYGILVDRRGVCLSYAYAFQILMNRLDIPSIYVGSAKLNHAWNAVQLDGKWYHIDETWDDGASPDVLGRALHKNFLKSTSSYDVSHCPPGVTSPYTPDDFIGLDRLTNVLLTDTGTEYDSFWWDTVESGILPIETNGVKYWYYLNKDGTLCSRDSANLLINEGAAVTEYAGGPFAEITVKDNQLYCTTGSGEGDLITSYNFVMEDGEINPVLQDTWNLPNYGIACMDNTIYYAETQYPAEWPPYLDYVRTVKDLDGNLLPLPPEPGLLVTEENFPDEAFRNYVLTYFDTDRNGYLSRSQRESVSWMDVTGQGIADLTGLALFPNVSVLKCGSNRLTTLDVTENEKLVELGCESNEITELKCGSALEWLVCDHNRLTELDVSGIANLNTLECSYNQLRTLDVGENAKLEQLSCMGNRLTELALGANPLLKALKCSENDLSTLDLSANPALDNVDESEIDRQTLGLTAALEGDNWVVSLAALPGFDATKVAVTPGPGGYPRYENGKVILCGKNEDPNRSFYYWYATGAAVEEFNRMEVIVNVSAEPVPIPPPAPTATAPATASPTVAPAPTATAVTATAAPAGTAAQGATPVPRPAPAPTPAPAAATHYIVCEACGHHDWVPYLDGYQCTNCGHLRGTTGVAAPAAAGSGKGTRVGGIPATADAETPALTVVVLLLSGFGLGCGVYKKKKAGR